MRFRKQKEGGCYDTLSLVVVRSTVKQQTEEVIALRAYLETPPRVWDKTNHVVRTGRATPTKNLFFSPPGKFLESTQDFYPGVHFMFYIFNA